MCAIVFPSSLDEVNLAGDELKFPNIGVKQMNIIDWHVCNGL